MNRLQRAKSCVGQVHVGWVESDETHRSSPAPHPVPVRDRERRFATASRKSSEPRWVSPGSTHPTSPTYPTHNILPLILLIGLTITAGCTRDYYRR
jgi:hypothetical protein